MIPGLDGLRAIAFLFVFLFHAKYLDAGWVGVQLFFVLSGFLITGILLDMKKSLSTRDFFVKFYGRRFLRIFPLYYFYLIAMGLLTTWLISINYRVGWMELFTKQAKYAVFYVFDFYAATTAHNDFYFLTHFWSLSVEEQFYIFWPLLILLTPEKYIKNLSLGLIIITPVLRFAGILIYQAGIFSFLPTTPWENIYYLPFMHIDAFAFGSYLSRYSIPKSRLQWYILAIWIVGGDFISGILAITPPCSSFCMAFLFRLPESIQFIFGYSLINYFFALTIHEVVKNRLFVNFLDWKPLQYLGKISYGLYVYHFAIIWFALDIRDLGIIRPELVKPVSTIVAFIGTLLISSLSYHWLEKPLLKLKDIYFSRS